MEGFGGGGLSILTQTPYMHPPLIGAHWEQPPHHHTPDKQQVCERSLQHI